MVTAKKAKVASVKAPEAAIDKLPATAKVITGQATAKTAPVQATPAKAPPAEKSVSAQSKSGASPSKNVVLSAQQRIHYVEVAAFYIAERRGFAPGNPDEDWKAAEAEVDRLIASGYFAS